MMDENLRAALRLSHGDWGTLATRPLSSALLVAAALLVRDGGAAGDPAASARWRSRDRD